MARGGTDPAAPGLEAEEAAQNGGNPAAPGRAAEEAAGGDVDPRRMPDGALVAKRDAPVGGQAVLEGVMMRGISVWAVAVRKPDGEIEISSESIKPWAQRHRAWRLPVIRGVVALGEAR